MRIISIINSTNTDEDLQNFKDVLFVCTLFPKKLLVFVVVLRRLPLGIFWLEKKAFVRIGKFQNKKTELDLFKSTDWLDIMLGQQLSFHNFFRVFFFSWLTAFSAVWFSTLYMTFM